MEQFENQDFANGVAEIVTDLLAPRSESVLDLIEDAEMDFLFT